MATIENKNKKSLNSYLAEKIFLNELMLSPSYSQHIFISNNTAFTCIHKRVQLNSICRLVSKIIYDNHKKHFEQKLMVENKNQGGI